MFFNVDVNDIVESHNLPLDKLSAKAILEAFKLCESLSIDACKVINSIFISYPFLRDEYSILLKKMAY